MRHLIDFIITVLLTCYDQIRDDLSRGAWSECQGEERVVIRVKGYKA